MESPTVNKPTHSAIYLILLRKSIVDLKCEKEYGKTFRYRKAYLGRVKETQESDDYEYVMVEEMVEGEFTKYINNDGSIIFSEDNAEMVAKAECLSHFTFEKSKQELILVDIQGAGFNLYDPEISSINVIFDNEGFCFSIGNCSKVALEKFKDLHECNNFCNMLHLSDLH